jgi:hypothetical protein
MYPSQVQTAIFSLENSIYLPSKQGERIYSLFKRRIRTPDLPIAHLESHLEYATDEPDSRSTAFS